MNIGHVGVSVDHERGVATPCQRGRQPERHGRLATATLPTGDREHRVASARHRI